MRQDIEIETIYKYNQHKNIPWNIVEYKPEKEYFGKSVEPNYMTRKVTNNETFMDSHIKKVKKSLTSPGMYKTETSFNQDENKKFGQKFKLNPRAKKNTYLDSIESMGKKIKIGVGTYNLTKTLKQNEEELEAMKRYTKSNKSPRVSFISGCEFLAKETPGAGKYNPHTEIVVIKKEKTVPEDWRKKHLEESKAFIKLKRKEPGPSTYRPLSAGTFNEREIENEKSKKKRSKSLNKGFGTDAKFIYSRLKKRKIVDKSPDPAKYNLIINWLGKKDSTKKKGWGSFISNRSQTCSVYNTPSSLSSTRY